MDIGEAKGEKVPRSASLLQILLELPRPSEIKLQYLDELEYPYFVHPPSPPSWPRPPRQTWYCSGQHPEAKPDRENLERLWDGTGAWGSTPVRASQLFSSQDDMGSTYWPGFIQTLSMPLKVSLIRSTVCIG